LKAIRRLVKLGLKAKGNEPTDSGLKQKERTEATAPRSFAFPPEVVEAVKRRNAVVTHDRDG
jgi:hypothetical protein